MKDKMLGIINSKNWLRNGIIGMGTGGAFAVFGGGLLLLGLFAPGSFIMAGVLGGIGAILAVAGGIKWAVNQAQLKKLESKHPGVYIVNFAAFFGMMEQNGRIAEARDLIKWGGGISFAIGGACALIGGATLAIWGPCAVAVTLLAWGIFAVLPGLIFVAWGASQWVANQLIK